MTKREPETEQELADYYYAHRDDPDEWGKPVSPPRKLGRPSKGLSSTITVRFTPEEASIIYETSELENITLSEFVRKAVRQYKARGASRSAAAVAPPTPSGA